MLLLMMTCIRASGEACGRVHQQIDIIFWVLVRE